MEAHVCVAVNTCEEARYRGHQEWSFRGPSVGKAGAGVSGAGSGAGVVGVAGVAGGGGAAAGAGWLTSAGARGRRRRAGGGRLSVSVPTGRAAAASARSRRPQRAARRPASAAAGRCASASVVAVPAAGGGAVRTAVGSGERESAKRVTRAVRRGRFRRGVAPSATPQRGEAQRAAVGGSARPAVRCWLTSPRALSVPPATGTFAVVPPRVAPPSASRRAARRPPRAARQARASSVPPAIVAPAPAARRRAATFAASAPRSASGRAAICGRCYRDFRRAGCASRGARAAADPGARGRRANGSSPPKGDQDSIGVEHISTVPHQLGHPNPGSCPW